MEPMDRPRASQTGKRKIRLLLYVVLTLSLVIGITVSLSHLDPAPPRVDRANVWIDTVRKGPLVIQVRGSGKLVPEVARWIPARTQGRVQQLVVRPGATVRAGSIIVVLSNPELQRELLDAQLQLKASDAQYQSLQIQLESQLLTQRAAAASIEAEFHQAKLQADLNEQLAREGLISDLNLKLSRVRSRELETRYQLEDERLRIASKSIEAQLEVHQAEKEQLRALYELRLRQVEDLKVKPGFEGVVQQIPVEEGQQVLAGTNLARVAVPGRLKAEIRIPETQAKDIQPNLPATIDTHADLMAGTVVRIDPAAQQGTVRVDIQLEGTLPKSARPDLTVDGTIDLERLQEVLYVGRPAYSQSNTRVSLFKLVEEGEFAVRTPVQLGRATVTAVEIRQGLQEGDQVILSDTSQWENIDRIELD